MHLTALVVCLVLAWCSLLTAQPTSNWTFGARDTQAALPSDWNALKRPDRPNTFQGLPHAGLQLNGMMQSNLLELPNSVKQLKITLKTGQVQGFLKLYVFQYSRSQEVYFKQCGEAFDLKKTAPGTYTTALKIGLQRQKYIRFVLDGQDAVIHHLTWQPLKSETRQIAPGRLTIPEVAGVPNLGTQFNPAEWRDSLVLQNPFISLSHQANILNREEIRLKSDGKTLFVGLKMTTPPVARITQKDGDIYKDDSLELIFQPQADLNRQFHLAVNPRGVVFDEEKAVGQSFVNWDCPGLQTATQRDGQDTYLVVAVPFKSVNIAPEKGWLFNACRNYARTSEFSALNHGGYFKNLYQVKLSKQLKQLYVSADKVSGRLQFQAAVQLPGQAVWTVSESGGESVMKQQLLNRDRAVIQLEQGALNNRTFRVKIQQDKQELFAATCRFSNQVTTSAPTQIKRSQLHYYPLQKKVAVTLKELTFREQGDIGEIRGQINGQALKMPAVTTYPAGVFTQCAFPITQRGTVPWQLTVYRKDGTVFETNRGTVEVATAFPWQNNTLGQDDIVIPPFTPLQVKGRQIACARRTYSLGANGFPASIVAAGAEVLARPITLMLLKQDNSVTEIKSTQLQFTRRQKHRVEFTAELTAPDLKGQLSAWLEYDGLIYYTLKLQAQRPIPVKKLYLEIPFKQAELFHVVGPNFRNQKVFWHTQDLPGEGVIWKSTQVPAPANVYGNFLPSLWLGSHRNGLSFFAESDRNWINKRRSPIYQLLRNQGQLSLKINLIATKTTLQRPMTVQFGLIATPLKPRTVTGADQAINWGTSFARTLFNTGFQLRDPFISRLMLDPRAKAAYVIYSAGQEYVQGDPDFKTFANECDKALKPTYNPWEVSLLPFRTGGMKHEDYISRNVIWNQYRVDFMLWQLNKILTQTPVDGVYLDNSYATFSQNPLIKNGGFQRPDGFWQGRSNILMQREYLKRAAVLAYLHHKRFPRVVVHNTGAMIPACFAFADCFFDGEMDVTDYYETFSPSWNEIMLAVDWGVIPGRLSMIRQQKNDQTRPLLSIFKLHDMKLWHSHNGLDNQLYGQLRRIEADFGTTAPDCRFFGYWQKDNPVKLTGNCPMRTSCFHRGNKLLVYVSNPTRQAGTTTLVLPQSFSAVDALSGQNMKPTIKVNSHDFQVLIINYTKEKK